MWGLLYTTAAVQWNIYLKCVRHYFFPRACASNVKCMYSSAFRHITDCNEFIGGMYIDTLASYLQRTNFLLGTWESYFLTVQCICKIVQSSLYSWIMQIKKIRCYHLMFIFLLQGGILQGTPQVLFRFQLYYEGDLFGYSWKLEYLTHTLDILNLEYRRSLISIYRYAFRHFCRCCTLDFCT